MRSQSIKNTSSLDIQGTNKTDFTLTEKHPSNTCMKLTRESLLQLLPTFSDFSFALQTIWLSFIYMAKVRFKAGQMAKGSCLLPAALRSTKAMRVFSIPLSPSSPVPVDPAHPISLISHSVFLMCSTCVYYVLDEVCEAVRHTATLEQFSSTDLWRFVAQWNQPLA